MPQALLSALLGLSFALSGGLITAKRSYAIRFRDFDDSFADKMHEDHIDQAKEKLTRSEDYRDMALYLTFPVEYSIFAMFALGVSLFVDYLFGGPFYAALLAVAFFFWLLMLIAPMIKYETLFHLDSGFFRPFSKWYMNASWLLCALKRSPLGPLTDPGDLARHSQLKPLILGEKTFVDLLTNLKDSTYRANAGPRYVKWPLLFQPDRTKGSSTRDC